jgi:streptogramin lyase
LVDGHYGSEYEGGEGSFVGHLESGGQVQQLALPSTETAGTPVIDPAGGVWLPLSDAPEDGSAVAIGHLSSGGDFQRYPLGNKRGNTYLMARSGTDLWVGGAVVDKREGTAGTFIDQVSTSPTVTVQRRIRLSRKCSPSAIAAGETEVWFAELCENRSPSHPSWRAAIVQVEPSGKLERYRLPRLSYVTSLAIGADGTVWFGSFGTNGTKDELGHVSPGGSLSRYRVGDVDPYEIAVGPEGRLWFTEEVQGYPHAALNSIGPDGDLGRPTCLAPKCKLEPFGLAFAPNGELWFSALTSEVPYGGGGVGGLILAEDRANQAGFIGHLTATVSTGAMNSQKPTVQRTRAYGVDDWSAVMEGSVNPRGVNCLAPSTTYHFRLVAKNAAGKTYGPDHAFTTTPPLASSESVYARCPGHGPTN